MIKIILLTILSLTFTTPILSQCTTTTTSRRPEWRQLSAQQKQSYSIAVRALKTKPKGPDSDPSQWNHDQFASTHANYYAANHERPAFFPWHRAFLHYYERALGVAVPYWDWGMDSNHPGAADLFDENEDAFGGAGDAADSYCVKKGIAAGWNTHFGGCLKRCSSWGTLDPVEVYSHAINTATTLQQLQSAFEDHVHSAVHYQYGGRGCDAAFPTSNSANDPIFFLHHAMVDKVWALWQARCPATSSNYSDSLSSPLPPFSNTVQSVMRIDSLCYAYTSSLIDSQVSKTCASSGGGGVVESKIMDPSWLQNAVIALVPTTSIPHLLSKRDILTKLTTTNDTSTTKLTTTNETLTTKVTTNVTTTDETLTTDKSKRGLPGDFDTVMASCLVQHPSRDDRGDMENNRCGTPLPSHIIARKGLDETRIRQEERFSCSLVHYWNCKDGYTSPSALKYYQTYNSIGLWRQ